VIKLKTELSSSSVIFLDHLYLLDYICIGYFGFADLPFFPTVPTILLDDVLFLYLYVLCIIFLRIYILKLCWR